MTGHILIHLQGSLQGSDMEGGFKNNALRRRDAVGMDELVEEFIREMKLASGINRQRVREAWNVVSGAGKYTMDVQLVNGVMYCNMASSMVRNQLYFQKDVLLAQVNEYLKNDALYVKNGEKSFIKDIVLK